nr:hypothetical protein [Arthrobacter sp. B1805]
MTGRARGEKRSSIIPRLPVAEEQRSEPDLITAAKVSRRADGPGDTACISCSRGPQYEGAYPF